MAFKDNIPKEIERLESQIKALKQESYKLDWGHDCNCEFCDEKGEIPPETEDRDAEITKEIAIIRRDIERLERYKVLVVKP